VGLVQFQTFVVYLYKGALYAASFVAHKKLDNIADSVPNTYDGDLASPFFFALIVAGFVSGTFLSYLETRTRLTLLFVGALQGTKADQSSHDAQAQ
jgi:hypothetical protein